MQVKLKTTQEVFEVVRFENLLTPNETVVISRNGVEEKYKISEVEVI